MADCSKTVDFFRERDRMCDSFANCKGCPFEIPDGACNIEQDIEYSIKIIQQWSDEHPEPKQKTYADVFLEKFQKQHIEHTNPGWQKRICRTDIFDGTCKHGDCKKCWNEPYEED